MQNLKLKRKSSHFVQQPEVAESIKELDVQNLFQYLRQGVDSPIGFVDKSKALSNILMKESVFKYLVNSPLKKTTNSGITIGSKSMEGYTYTSIHTQADDKENHSVYARNQKSRVISALKPGIVIGFLLRKEKTKNKIKNILEATLILNHGKKCTVRYDYDLAI